MTSFPIAVRICGVDARRRHCSTCCKPEVETSSRQLFRCGACKELYYCSKACQVRDWKAGHKVECGHHLRWTNRFGNNTQNFDDLCLVARTLLHVHGKDGPESCSEMASYSGHSLHVPRPVACGLSHWNAMDEVHIWREEEEECEGGGDENEGSEEMGSAARDKTLRLAIAQEAAHALSELGVTQELAVATQRKFSSNNFSIFNEHLTGYAAGVYPWAAVLNHSCAPNCVVRFEFSSKAEPPLLHLVAVQSVSPGDELCHSYVDLMLTTPNRQLQLKQKYEIDKCDCVRCSGGAMAPWPVSAEGDNALSTDIDPFFFDTGTSTVDMGVDGTRRRHTFLPIDDFYDIMPWARDVEGKAPVDASTNSHIFSLLAQADTALGQGDDEGELVALRSAMHQHDALGLPPVGPLAYRICTRLLSAYIVAGQHEDALAFCKRAVVCLCVALAHVEHHPMLGLQLFTLADLYEAQGAAAEERATRAYRWARRVLVVTHGKESSMVRRLDTFL